MALLYSPVDGSQLAEPFSLFPRSAFLMIHDNDRVAAVEARMQAIAREEIESARFEARAASELKRTGDFLAKIIGMIRGCGFGIAIFSDATPPATMANIFFEVGYCLALGKPTFLLVAGDSAPSDFVRSEWISYDHKDERLFRSSVRKALSEMEEYGRFLETIASAAEDAEEMNPELAFEGFKRAYLISGRGEALDGIRRVHTRLAGNRSDAEIGRMMRSYRRKLSDDMRTFMKLG